MEKIAIISDIHGSYIAACRVIEDIKKRGIKRIFCNSKDVIVNKIPLPVPNVAILEDMVYPKQNPLYAIIPYTIGIPITVEPTNHSPNANTKLEINVSFNNPALSISMLFFRLFTKSLIYDVISSICVCPALLMKIIPNINPIKKIIVIIVYSFKLFFI